MARSENKKTTGFGWLVVSIVLGIAGVYCIVEDLAGLGGLLIAGALLVFGMAFSKGHSVNKD